MQDILHAISDRCDRWMDAERSRIEAEVKAGGTWPHRNAMPSFSNWPESMPHHAVQIAWCSAAARDSRFWKNGDVVSAGRRVDQLELVMRYGPQVISDGDGNDLASWIETECEPYGSLYRDELEQWMNAEDGLFQALRDQSWKDPFAGDGGAVVDLLAERGLDGLLWDLEGDSFNREGIRSILWFCARHGVYLLDDTGWLISGWRGRAVLTLGKALDALPEGTFERNPWLAEARLLPLEPGEN